MPSKVFCYTVHVYNKGHIFVEPEELNKYNLSTFRSPHQRPSSGLTTQSSYGDLNDVYRKYFPFYLNITSGSVTTGFSSGLMGESAHIIFKQH